MSICRICTNSIQPIISYGKMPIANGFLTPKKFDTEYFFELACGFCEHCFMFQLIEQPAPEIMFHDQYAFFSQTSKSMCQHFEGVANNIVSSLQNPSPFVIELGCNDGIMLKHIANKKINHLGIEPSTNVAAVANSHGVKTSSEFFSLELAKSIKIEHQSADIIYSANVMCHIPNLPDLALGIAHLLTDDGRLIFEDPYLGDVLQKTSYDQIYDEHVFLFSLHSVSQAFGAVGLELINCEHLNTHGGSMRYTLARTGKYPVSASVRKHFEFERKLGLNRLEPYLTFAHNCQASKLALVSLFNDLKSQGKIIAGYAATSKSTTILNYCGINNSHLDYICDTTPIKQGKYTPGTHIPVVPYEHFQNTPPDYAFLFAWNHLHEVMDKEQGFITKGGKWVTHVPKVEIFQREYA
ncbi:MAG: class I SAM-dependent methyltransferase [Francisellaceae bacterium]|nr:class I SAM-dependent methyltransferase [Francisellaceae bacterium]MBT6538073.1 class I SAM-dependent methyltransferase [Francisellaceae bacterium]